MFTTRGKTFIKRFMAGQAGSAVGAISVGIGSTSATAADERLQFEFARFPISNIAYDQTTDRIVFKGSLPTNVGGKIYEVGLWTSEVNSMAGNQASRLITTFDSADEIWVPEPLDTTTNRIGGDSLYLTPAASTTSSSVMSNLSLNFIDNSAADQFVFAYNVANANTASIGWQFRTNSANLFEFVVTNPTAGYKFSTFNKGAATVVGTPAWDDINEIGVWVTSKNTGTSAVSFEGIRIEDVDTVSSDYGLITRYVLPSPVLKEEGAVQDFEYVLAVTI